MRNAIINLGSRDALARMAHLLCEIYTRLSAVGLTKNWVMSLPFTQTDLGAACGISAVHVNRTVQALRRRGLLEWRLKEVILRNWAGIVRLAAFSAS